MEKDIYTVEEVAQRLRVTPKAVRTWLSGRRLTAMRIGREWQIQERDLRLVGVRKSSFFATLDDVREFLTRKEFST